MPVECNPFTPDDPVRDDRLFANQEDVIDSILTILQRPPKHKSSCAVIGSVGMGKTSILLRVERMLWKTLADHPSGDRIALIPVYLELGMRRLGDEKLLKALFASIVGDIKSQLVFKFLEHFNHKVKFDNRTTTRVERMAAYDHPFDWEDVAVDVSGIVRPIENHLGREVKIVLLLDNIHELQKYPNLPIDFAEALFDILRNRISNEGARALLSVVLACRDNLREQLPVKRTESLVKVVEIVRLKPFPRTESLQAIQDPLKNYCDVTLIPEVAEEVYRWIGGHPRFTSSLMRRLLESRSDIQKIESSEIETLESTLLEEIRGLIDEQLQSAIKRRFVAAIFDILQGSNEALDFLSIRTRLEPQHERELHDLRSVLDTLEHFGVISASGNVLDKKYAFSGEIFRRWAIIATLDVAPAVVEITGTQREKLHAALLNAFPHRSQLEQLAALYLQENLNELVGTGALRVVVFELIQWAEAHGRIAELVDSACKMNPGNHLLREIAQQLPGSSGYPENRPLIRL